MKTLANSNDTLWTIDCVEDQTRPWTVVALNPGPVARTPQSGAQHLRVELLLVLADLWSVAVRSNVGRIDVDHRALPVVLSSDWLAFTASCRGDKHPNETPRCSCEAALSARCVSEGRGARTHWGSAVGTTWGSVSGR